MNLAKEIRRRFQKPREQEQIYAWYVTRRLSPYFTVLFLKARLTPNQVTSISILSAVIAGLFFTGATPVWCLLGALFFNLMYILDGSDGELARIKKIFSKEGEYLDKLGHYICDLAILNGINLGMFRFTHNPFFLYALPLVSIGVVGNRLIYDTAIKALYILRYRNGIPPRDEWAEGAKDIFLGWQLCFSQSKYEKSPRGFWRRKLYILLRIAPHLGYVYDPDGMLLFTTLAALVDIFLPALRLNTYHIRAIGILGGFYALAFPITFLLRLRLILKERMLTRWLAALSGDGRKITDRSNES